MPMDYLTRARECRDYMVKHAQSVPQYELIRVLKALKYTNAEIKLGFVMFLEWMM